MLTLLKNLTCYCPEYAGVKDVLIAGDKIYRMFDAGSVEDTALVELVVPCEGLTAFPGIVDQHMHIVGGGGEQSFASRAPEMEFQAILMAGVTTAVGLLGADGSTRSLEGLYAKAKSLESQGLSTFMYSGSYTVPAVTLTGSILRDLVLIDKVVGAGEIAISDHRSSQPGLAELLKLASDTHLGGLLGGKAGVVHLHVGDGKGGLAPLFAMVENSDLPLEQFVPTHLNRSQKLLRQAAEYCRQGGNVDLTAGETAGVAVPEAVKRLRDAGADLNRVTVSSDAGGSIPGGGIASVGALFEDVKGLLKAFGLSEAINLVTKNPAKNLKLYPKKGALKEGSDADILILDRNFDLDKLVARGRLLVDGGRVREAV